MIMTNMFILLIINVAKVIIIIIFIIIIIIIIIIIRIGSRVPDVPGKLTFRTL